MRLTNTHIVLTLLFICSRVSEGLLLGVSEGSQLEISGLKREVASLLTPPIHPRVPTLAVPVAIRRLISRAGRDGIIRSA